MHNRVALLIVGDGRKENLTHTVQSARKYLNYNFTVKHMHNDAAENPEYGEYLQRVYENEFEIFNHDVRLGLSGSIKLAWEELLKADIDFVFHLEEDFLFDKAIDIDQMIDILCQNKLAQLALKRDPNNESEHAAGGWMQQRLDLYTQCNNYVEQHHLFILNPCLYPRSIMCDGWPVGGGETEITGQLHTLHPTMKFGVLGTIDDPPRVIHTGRRSDKWKL